MNRFIKTSLISYLAVAGAICSITATANEAPASQTAGASADSAKPNPIIPEAYILYSLALRDGKAADSKDTTMSVTKQNGKATYTFKDHVLKECGSHLNGSIDVVDSGSNNVVSANFPAVVNTMGITHFTLQMTEEKANKINAKGTGKVNDTPFAVADIVSLPGFSEAIAKMQ